MWLADSEKILKICLFVYVSVADRILSKQTDARTPHDSMGPAYIALRGNKTNIIKACI